MIHRKFHIYFFITTILGNLFCNSLQAQNKEKTMTRIHYRTTLYYYEGQKAQKEDETILDIGDSISHFYSLNTVQRDLIKDSIIAKGGKLGDIINAWEKSGYPRGAVSYQIWKNYPSFNTFTVTHKLVKRFRYSEPMNRLKWTLNAKDSIVANYKCQQAETFYLGRKWKVWFTSELPIHDGPWKLHGLPGLILHAEDSEHLFSFSCIQVENIKDKVISLPQKKKYIDCTKKELHDIIIFEWKDPIGSQEKLTGFRGAAFDANGRPMSYPERKAIIIDNE